MKVSKNSANDANISNRFNPVRMDNLKMFTGTIQDWINQITHLKSGYLVKPNGRTVEHYWWSDKDKWFMCHATQKIRKNGQHVWKEHGMVIASDMESHIKYIMRVEGYEMFIKK